jgi:putative membrane protein
LSVVPAWAADSSAERDFLTRASNSNLFAIEESRLALDRSGDSQVKTFARRLVEDHESAEAELKAASEGSGAAVPTALDEEHQARLTALRGRSGTDFDKAYVADQGENHSPALTLYGDYMLWGAYEKLHALAIKMIPITDAQLKDAQALAGD